jgi:glycosyltransferase involved in cell wall biosynthesis
VKVMIDAHMAGQRETGNERYILGLLEGLACFPAEVSVVIAVSDPDSIPGPLPAGWKTVPVSHSPWIRLFHELPRIARAEKADLLHVTYCGPLRCPCPLIVTIHDVSYWRHPYWFSVRDRLVLKTGIALSVARASGILTISRHAGEEIKACYGVNDERLTVTPLAVGPQFRNAESTAPPVESIPAGLASIPYFLAVGNLQPRKNIERLIEAFALFKKNTALPHRLVVAGQAKWRESDIVRALARHGFSSDVLFPGYIPDTDLVRLYQGAEAFVYPSLYEGFGLPILEAMACGTPVISSSTSAMPETAGKAALLADPLDINAWAHAMATLVLQPGLRDQLNREGLARAALFSWKQTARLTLDAYQRWACEK